MIIAPTIVALREGIEAALVIAIMLIYLRKTERTNLIRYVFGGVIVALVSSIMLAIILGGLWGVFEGPVLNIFEGSVVLVAAALLTTMIFWMWTTGSKISSEIETSMESQVGKESGIGLMLLAFALVVREGVELVLFSFALAIQDGTEIVFGIVLGLSIAIILGVGIYQGSLHVSLRSFFNWTSVLLVLFAAGMIAYGIHELQEAGILLIGPIEVWDVNPPLLPGGEYPLLHEKGIIGGLAKALFGYNGNPSALEVVGYISYLIVIILVYLYLRRKKRITPTPQSPGQGLTVSGTNP